MHEGNLWDVERTADYLNCSVETVYYLIDQDRLPGVVRLGPRLIRFDPDPLKDWVAAGGFSAVAL